MRDIALVPFSILNFKSEGNPERRILGHLPYNEIPKDKLVLIEPNVEVHIDMLDSLYKYERRSEKKMGHIWSS